MTGTAPRRLLGLKAVSTLVSSHPGPPLLYLDGSAQPGDDNITTPRRSTPVDVHHLRGRRRAFGIDGTSRWHQKGGACRSVSILVIVLSSFSLPRSLSEGLGALSVMRSLAALMLSTEKNQLTIATSHLTGFSYALPQGGLISYFR
jgi:hypothetical protein